MIRIHKYANPRRSLMEGTLDSDIGGGFFGTDGQAALNSGSDAAGDNDGDDLAECSAGADCGRNGN